MCEMRVQSMSLIGGNLLNTLLLILMIITHSSSLLQISYVLMSPYRGDMERVVIFDQFVFADVCGNRQEARKWGRET